jgi:hypothetical protein
MESETITGIVPNTTRKKGWFSQQSFNLVLTDKRIIAAELTSGMIKNEAAKVSKDAKEQGAGILSRTFSTLFSGYSVYKKYYTMLPADILQENPGNFCIDAGTIEKIKINHKHVERDGQHYDETEIQIKASGGKYSFKLTGSGMSSKDAKDLFAKAYPGKV